MNNENDVLAYDGWLKVYKRKYKGKMYDILHSYDAVAVIVLNQDDKILLVKQYRPAVNKETLEIPAGCLDIAGETPERCAVRELEEEADIKLSVNNLKKVITYKTNVGCNISTMNLYISKIETGNINKKLIDDDDVYEALWLDINEINDKISTGEICDSKTIMSYLYLKDKLSN